MRTRENPLLLGLAAAQSDWPRRVVDWTTSGSLQADFAQCVSQAELVDRLQSTSRPTALLFDSAVGDPTPDVLAAAQERESLLIVVGRHGLQEWAEPDVLCLRPEFGQHELNRGLAARFASREQDRTVGFTSDLHHDREPSSGVLVAVCGRSGSGVSTTAIALAQGLAGCDRSHRGVLLADLSRRADQALLHDAAAERPDISDLFDSAAGRVVHAKDVHALTFSVPQRGYHVLLGPVGGFDRSSIDGHCVERALSAMRAGYSVTVLDLDDDFSNRASDGGIDGGHVVDLDAVTSAEAVVVVGAASLTGIGGLLHAVRELHSCGVSASRVRPVLARIAHRRGPGRRMRAVDSLLAGESLASGAVHTHERPELDDVHHDTSAMPSEFVDTLMKAVEDIAARVRLGIPVPDQAA